MKYNQIYSELEKFYNNSIESEEKYNQLTQSTPYYTRYILELVSSLPHNDLLELSNLLKNVENIPQSFKNLIATTEPGDVNTTYLLNTSADIIEFANIDYDKSLKIIRQQNSDYIFLLQSIAIFVMSYLSDKQLAA